MVDHLIEACPNIESLFVGHKGNGNGEIPTSVDFLSAIRFKNLISLSLVGFNLSDGSFLPSVITK